MEGEIKRPISRLAVRLVLAAAVGPVVAANARLLTAVPHSRWDQRTTRTVAFDENSSLQVQITFRENVTNRIFSRAVLDGDQWFLARNAFWRWVRAEGFDEAECGEPGSI